MAKQYPHCPSALLGAFLGDGRMDGHHRLMIPYAGFNLGGTGRTASGCFGNSPFIF